MRRVAWLAAWPAGVALGAASVLFARTDPGNAFFADTGATIALELLAGYALIACGLECWRRRPGSRFGVLLAAGGCGWFLLEWNNPGVGSPVVFTIGLVLYAAAPPLIAHALLSYPAASLGRLEGTVVAVAYGSSVLALGPLSALVFNPVGQGCNGCPRNLLLIHSSTSLYRALNRAGIYLGLAWTTAAVALIGWRLARSTTALRGVITPAVLTGGLYLSFVAAEFAVSLRRGFLDNDPLDRRLYGAEAVSLVLLAASVAWSWLRARRTRTRLARLVVELAEAPSPGRLERALARSLRDPGLRLSYPLGDGRYIDADGQPREPGQAFTALMRNGIEVALLTHKPGLLDDSGLVDEVAATVRLALENERLHAELLAQLADLRASRARIVTTGDAERRRLERDLHDGGQQRLVAVAITLRIARARLEAQAEPDLAMIPRIEQAEDEVRNALADLRTLASGIFPAVLGDEGLFAAVEELAEETGGKLRITGLPERRFDPAVEMTAYRLISRTLDASGSEIVSLTASARDGRLVLELLGRHLPLEVAELEDRFGALDGTLEFCNSAGGRARLRGELPCA